ncbi:ribosome maturation factor RimM [Herbaspirillum sp. alder98]|uniref:ribosome maturation factor RimM n=1 Tax=Herbaspirillum sp. alder98 TaxID=2913096 RepID=UPI001CD82728|nr:ribosome maturation factor RimM [Herbaspirillum sp. alder98]MCA1324620.1 ribosome maturation factor RimM [Herbaspirillum sp. alder98]
MNNSVQPGFSAPDDLVTVGYVTGAYGIQGWVRVKPYSSDADALLSAKTWWLDKPGTPKQDIEVMQSKGHSGDVVARLVGVADRNAAEAMKGHVVHISRRHFPALDDGEFYWVDLIGLSVENLQGVQLGVVSDMMDNGAHPILKVARALPEAPADGKPGANQTEQLIPYVDQFVKTVQLQEKKIIVDWDLDY